MSPALALHAQTSVRGMWGERRCPPSNDQWDEDEHCPNTALFAQMYSALLIENASRVQVNGRWYTPEVYYHGFHPGLPIEHTCLLVWGLLLSKTQYIEYIGLPIAQHTWQFCWIIEAQQHWYFLRHIGLMQIMEFYANSIYIYDCSLTYAKQ